jgi:hypothetical protein
MEGFERTLATITEVFVFKIPPQQSAAGHRYNFRSNFSRTDIQFDTGRQIGRRNTHGKGGCR